MQTDIQCPDPKTRMHRYERAKFGSDQLTGFPTLLDKFSYDRFKNSGVDHIGFDLETSLFRKYVLQYKALSSSMADINPLHQQIVSGHFFNTRTDRLRGKTN